MARFFRMHLSVSRRTDISMAAKAIHAVLASYASMGGIAFPSQARIGECLGISGRHVRNGIAELEAAGLVERIAGGGRKSSQYHLAKTDLDPGTDDDNRSFESGTILPLLRKSSSAQGGTVLPGSVEDSFHSERKNTSANAEEHFRLIEEGLIDSSIEELAALSEEFFKLYPKRTELHLAQSYFSGYTLDQAKAALEGLGRWLYSAEWQRDGGQYIPSPAKFLAQKRWKDFPEQASSKLEETPLFDEAVA